MDIAQRLYSKGFISYPRTESNNYSNSFDFKEIINNLRKYDDSEISEYCKHFAI